MTTSTKWRRQIYGSAEQRVGDLNQLVLETDAGTRPLSDVGAASADGATEVVFRGLEDRLVELIRQAPVVVGCIAWMTSPRVLAALADCNGVGIVVQKEDFLRPDVDAAEGWEHELRRLYERLPTTLIRYAFPYPLGSMSVATDPSLAAVRCVGMHNGRQRRTVSGPRMHNKFLIFGQLTAEYDSFADVEWHAFKANAVWTGSFNLTRTASSSFENAVILRQPELARAYLEEFCQIAALSEPLDWDSAWVAPEWRIGT